MSWRARPRTARCQALFFTTLSENVGTVLLLACSTAPHGTAPRCTSLARIRSQDEVEKIVSFWEQGKGNAKNRLVLYNCTSGYPVPFDDVCLLELRDLYDKYAHRVKHLGFSGHHLGIAVDVAAYAMGATWNERHFTKDRTWKGTDHAASLEPAGMTKLCRDLKATWKCMSRKSTDILPIEAEQRAKLKWGCYNVKK